MHGSYVIFGVQSLPKKRHRILVSNEESFSVDEIYDLKQRECRWVLFFSTWKAWKGRWGRGVNTEVDWMDSMHMKDMKPHACVWAAFCRGPLVVMIPWFKRSKDAENRNFTWKHIIAAAWFFGRIDRSFFRNQGDPLNAAPLKKTRRSY